MKRRRPLYKTGRREDEAGVGGLKSERDHQQPERQPHARARSSPVPASYRHRSSRRSWTSRLVRS